MVHQLRRQLLVIAAKLTDLTSVAVSFGAAALIVLQRPGGPSARQLLASRLSFENVVALVALLVCWHVLCSSFGLYRSRRMSSFASVVWDVVRATTCCTIVAALGGVLLGIRSIGPSFLLIFLGTSTTLTLATRLVLRSVTRWVRDRGRNLRMVLVVGTNPRSLRFAHDMATRSDLGYRIIGFADDDWPGVGDLDAQGFERVATLSEIPAFLRENVVDEVVIAIPIKDFYEPIMRIIHGCGEQGITVRLISDILFDLHLERSRTEHFLGETVLSINSGAMEGWPVLVKRSLDAGVAAILLAVLSPVLIGIALLIKLTSEGPVFFLQERIGLNKRRFRMFKFRTMVADAEARLAKLEHLNEADGPVFKMRDDPRVTGVGRFLRRTSLDELPQLLNVLAGDMSLVGPRPLPLRDYASFDDDCQRRRLSVRPGMTGLWQVSGRSTLPFDRWLEFDLHYIDHWSLWLDLKILARTVPAVLRGTGAA